MELLAQLPAALEAMRAAVPPLHEARTRWGRTQSDADRADLDRAQAAAEEAHRQYSDLLERVQAASGLPADVFEAMDEPQLDLDRVNRTARAQLTAAEIAPNHSLEDSLANGLDEMKRRLPSGWLDEESADLFRLPDVEVERPVSIVRGVRPESEKSDGHRLRQMIRSAEDFLSGSERYDHFGGAMLVPQLARLGNHFAMLDTIANADERISNLWRKAAEVDTTAYELLVAAALAEKGRQPSFIPETQEKTPDVRCLDPFPLVVECKRRQALPEYDQREEAVMRALFTRIDAEARKLGLFGVFELSLTIEAEAANLDEIAEKAKLQRLAARPETPLAYAWGTIAYREAARRIELPAVTKAYSPDMLELAFGWESDLPEWDGLVCKIASPEGVLLDVVREGVALAWRNDAPVSIEKRSRSPTALFGSATKQIPAGEHAVVYMAYNEGAREVIADQRSAQALNRMHDWEHSAMFRIPLVVMNRLYPRPLGWGQPDLIESSIPLLSEASGGERWYLEAFPSRIFVPR